MSDQAVALIQPAELVGDARDEIYRLAQAAADYADASASVNTRRAYASDWADFASWCMDMRRPAMPAAGDTVALYLTARAQEGIATSTLERRLSAIRGAHKAQGFPKPESGTLNEVWKGIRRTHGRPPRKKRALVTADLKRAVNATSQGSLTGLRDRAMMLIGFAGALRRSELAALEVGPQTSGAVRLVFVSGGAEIYVDRSKGDQEGRGAVVAIPNGKTRLCPIKALNAWLDAAQIRAGPVFRPIDRHGNVGAGALTAQTVALVVKAAADRVGLDPEMFAGHSLRSGLITSAAEAGEGLDAIMGQSRHKKADTALEYVQGANRMKRSVAGKVGL